MHPSPSPLPKTQQRDKSRRQSPRPLNPSISYSTISAADSTSSMDYSRPAPNSNNKPAATANTPAAAASTGTSSASATATGGPRLSSPSFMLAPSHGQQPVGRKLIVSTEFVYIDDQEQCPAQQVSLRGDWNGWTDIAMMREQGRTWFVVTPVSNGYHEFSFVCDGKVITSPRHPTTQDNKFNWRIVMGPANYDELIKHRNAKRNNKRPFFIKWLLHLLLRLGIVTDVGNLGGEDDALNPTTAMEMHAERVNHWTNVFSKQKNLVLPSTAAPKPKLRSMGSWLTELGVVGFVIVGVLTYVICTSLYSVVFGK